MATVFVEELSIFSVVGTARACRGSEEAEVRYFKKGIGPQNFILFLRLMGISVSRIEKIKYSIADMTVKGEKIGIKVQIYSAEVSEEMFKKIRERRAYKELEKYIRPERLAIHFRQKAYEEVYPWISSVLVVASVAESEEIGNKTVYLYADKTTLGMARSVVRGFGFGLAPYNDLGIVKFMVKDAIKIISKTLKTYTKICASVRGFDRKAVNIAVHYAEGIEENKRNDIFWAGKSGIDPRKMLIYMDENKSLRGPIKKEVCDKVEEMGSGWICLKKEELDRSGCNEIKIKIARDIPGLKEIAALVPNLLDRVDFWITSTAILTAYEAFQWYSLFREFNIKVVFDFSVQLNDLTAQTLALDHLGDVRVGIQRSTVLLDGYQPFMIYNKNHVYFSWGREAAHFENMSRNLRYVVISGYPFDSVFTDGKDAATGNSPAVCLRKKGVKFVTALFDNVFSDDLPYSKSMMNEFYNAFLNWLIEDESVGIVLKEKRPDYFDDLMKENALISKAMETGRLVRTKDALGRFPSDASRGADMAIGIGISSAIVESVIAGCRGIHCDLLSHRHHRYYKWGEGRVIFDDLQKLMAALRKYKASPESESGLGDWSGYLDELDPFRDGRGSERVGVYLRLLQEAFQKGKSSEEAVEYVNGVYAADWGIDKIIKVN